MTTTTKLRDLRRRLDDLQSSRQTVRVGSAWSASLIAVCWAIVVLFLLDFRFELSVLQRVCLLAVGAGCVFWAFRRYTEPMLGQSEDRLEMALMVERQQGIDSDLVAALQFEGPEADKWGSQQLEGAVVDYVADFSKGLNIFEGFSREQLIRRGGTLAVTLAVIMIAVFAFPAHAAAFFNRMVLGSAHYPTKTNIVQVEINGKQLGSEPARKQAVKSPFGRPVQFRIHVAGELPQSGQVALRTTKRGLQTNIELRPVGDVEKGRQIFEGSLARLVDPVEYQLFMGDDWTDAARLLVTPLPVVDVQPQVTPPPYAVSANEELEVAEGARQLSVIEGSQVVLRLTSDKPLAEATLTIGEQTYPFEKKKAGGRGNLEEWAVNPAGTPLDRVMDAIQYEVNVVDKDELSLESPVKGYIRIKVDRQPRVQADVVTRHVLPSAQPTIAYGAVDDYGVARLRVLRELVRAGETTPLGSVEIPIDQSPQKTLRESYQLDLSNLKLAKGDKLRLTLEATDYRGDVEGKTAVSEPLVLQVTDKQGFLQAQLESDRKSDKQLDAIIRRQLGISGESR